jgi:hypothetical protein
MTRHPIGVIGAIGAIAATIPDFQIQGINKAFWICDPGIGGKTPPLGETVGYAPNFGQDLSNNLNKATGKNALSLLRMD